MKLIYRLRHRPWPVLLSILLIIIFGILLIKHHYSQSVGHSHKLLPSVVVTKVQRRNIPIDLMALGTVTSSYSVIIKTQVNGQLQKVLFREGQNVKVGSLLAQIDPRPYQAQLLQYQGQLARDRALLLNAQLDAKRYKLLWTQDSIAKQVLDTQAALVKQNEGIVRIDEGLIASTRLNLLYCNIISPINGRVGLRLVDPGNYVQTSDVTGLAVVNTLNPITVIFSVPEDNVSQIVTQLQAGKTLQAIAYDRALAKRLAVGKLLTIDNQIDTTTGMIKLKALFNNDQDLLFPNQFVNIKLRVATLSQAIVVPTAAIQHGAAGVSLVYVLNPDHTVSAKTVQVRITNGDDTVVSQGLAVGQLVVVEGVDKLIDGIKVKVSR